MTGVQPSKRWRVNFIDGGKALVMAMGTAICTFLLGSLDAGHLIWDWKGMVIAALSGVVTYISLTFLTKPPK